MHIIFATSLNRVNPVFFVFSARFFFHADNQTEVSLIRVLVLLVLRQRGVRTQGIHASDQTA